MSMICAFCSYCSKCLLQVITYAQISSHIYVILEYVGVGRIKDFTTDASVNSEHMIFLPLQDRYMNLLAPIRTPCMHTHMQSEHAPTWAKHNKTMFQTASMDS